MQAIKNARFKFKMHKNNVVKTYYVYFNNPLIFFLINEHSYYTNKFKKEK